MSGSDDGAGEARQVAGSVLVVIEVQSLLAACGFSPGPVDGIFGSLTQSAVRALQAARGLPVDGIVDQAALNALT